MEERINPKSFSLIYKLFKNSSEICDISSHEMFADIIHPEMQKRT